MNRIARLLCLVPFSFAFYAGNAAAADEGPKDNPYFSVMPSHEFIEAEDRDFDAVKFCPGKKTETIEGMVWRRMYHLREGFRQPSDLQIMRNYGNAVKSLGGRVLFEGAPDDACDKQVCGKVMTGKVIKGNKEIWIEAAPCNDGLDFWLTVVEKEGMRQDVTASADDLYKAISTQGHVALYINFDTAKAVIRPESKPILDEVTKMLKANPTLKLAVEGHTDNVGNPKKNQTLSLSRAKSVVAALTAQGIATSRLSAAGYGQDKPVADNDSETGRASNRRVELVKQ
jgi:outer membrane protein OmpA-like peptidoglycan-associated protein